MATRQKFSREFKFEEEKLVTRTLKNLKPVSAEPVETNGLLSQR